MRTKISLAVAVLALLTSAFAVAGELPAAKFQAILDKTAASGVPGIVLRVEMADGQAWTGAAGVANLNGPAVTPASVFRLYSISKMVTAATMFTLIDEGKIGLDDRIADLLDASIVQSLPNASVATVRQLIAQTSGIRDYADERFLALVRQNYARKWTPLELVALAADGAPAAPPGDSPSYYSNTNYTLLGLIIEKATRLPLAAAIRARVLKPLGADHTYSWEEEGRPEPIAGYLPGDATLEDVSTIDLSISWACGGLLSTAADTARITRGILAGSLLSPESRALMTTEFRPLAGRRVEYGYGSIRVPLFDPTPIGHSGEGPGFGALTLWWPDSGTIIVVLANLDVGAHFEVLQQAAAALTE